ncbi:sigma factor [Bacillus sp. 37MA]|uniref:sigma factor n=1 Tax=Bacillus sp. 37MA TaxID=1132442 RepID=UPI00037C443E|nr:sigma factor [Bacillus sp. 37MA]
MQFEQLATQYTPMIHRIMNKLHIYKNKEDYHQIGLIALWEAHKKFDSAKGAFPPYAYSYIQGRILNALTKDAAFSDETVLTGEPVLFEGIDPGPTPDTIAMTKAHGDHLSGRAKRWFDLSIIEGLTNPDIARRENVTPAAVRKWQMAAIKQLQEQFGDTE